MFIDAAPNVLQLVLMEVPLNLLLENNYLLSTQFSETQ
jgi:hypothetical protein